MRATLALFGAILLTACSRTSLQPMAAGCRNSSECGRGSFCRFEPGLCGRLGALGRCSEKPSACADRDEPVCACDGSVRASACAAFAAGLDLDVTGSCEIGLLDHIPCGATYCDARRSYCEIYLSDVRALPSEHRCRPLPADCLPRAGSTPSCACFPPDTPCLSFCGPLPGGGVQGFHLTCQGVRPPPRLD
jgi:hypothetical protein